MSLPNIAAGDPHVVAHNAERNLLNAIQDLSDSTHKAALSAVFGTPISSAKFGLAVDGSVDTVSWQAMIDEVSSAGGGLIDVERPSSGIYRLLDVYLKDNVWLRFKPGTVFKWPNVATQSSGDPAIFRLHTVDRALTTYVKNVRLYGQLIIDGTELTPTGGDRTNYPGGPRGVMLGNVTDFYIENVRGINIPGQAGNTIMANALAGGDRVVPNNGRIDRVTHESSAWKGNSAIQIGGARDVIVGYAGIDNGVGFRVEAHHSGPSNTINAVTENVRCLMASAEPTDSAQKNAAVYVLPHDTTVIRNVRVDQVRARNGAHGLYITHDSGAIMDNNQIGSIDVEGGGQLVKSENGNQYDFSGLVIGPGEVRAATGVGSDILPFATYRDCWALDSTLSGFRDLGLPSGTNVWSRFIGGGARRCGVQGFEVNNQSRVELIGVETNDPPPTPGSNLLSADEAGYETGTGTTYTVVGTATKAQSASIFRTGTKSLEVAAASTGTTQVRTAVAPTGKAVTAGQAVYAEAYVQAQITARTARIAVRFFDASNVAIGSDLIPATGAAAIGTWTKISGYVTAPAGAVQMAFFPGFLLAAVGDKMNFDDMVLAVATGSTPRQNYAVSVASGKRIDILGGDHSRNGVGVSTGAGTVRTASLV